MVLLLGGGDDGGAVFVGSRERVLKAWDASGDADEIAATFRVSRAWVHRLA